MKLMEMKVGDFVGELASNSPAPGGGTIAAVNGSFAAGLGEMTCLLTIPKETNDERKTQLSELQNWLMQARLRLVQLADEDTEAFNQVMAAFRMAKVTEEDKLARKQAIAKANLGATMVPAETAERSLEVLRMLGQAVSLVNDKVLSDCGVALSCAKTAVDGAAMNVVINLPGVKDEAKKAEFEAALLRIREESQAVFEKAMTRFGSRFAW